MGALYPIFRRELGYTDVDYSVAHNAEIAEYSITPYGYAVTGQIHIMSGYPPVHLYRICRDILSFDLSSLSPADEIFYAAINSFGYWATDVFDGYVFNGTGLTGATSDYGVIGSMTAVLGSATFPADGFQEYTHYSIVFNATGLAFLQSKVGGIVTLALRSSTDVSASPPGVNHYQEFYLQEKFDTKLIIPQPGGYIWVEGTKFAYLDAFRTKRLKEGTLTGLDDKLPGQISINTKEPMLGTDFCYVDSTGNERRIQGTLTGLSGKLAGQCSLNTIYPMYGMEFCYIDSDGNERRIYGGSA
jgi:hypothetical protein